MAAEPRPPARPDVGIVAQTTSPGPGSEMGVHPMIVARVRRLAAVSTVALGAVFFLAVDRLDAPVALDVALAAGWLSMPVLLALSIRRPRFRYLLVVPSTLVGAALFMICVSALPTDGVARAGWLSVTAGVLFGGVLGIWFWYRLLPVPSLFDEPFSPGRWTLITIHVAMIVAGLGLVIAAG